MAGSHTMHLTCSVSLCSDETWCLFLISKSSQACQTHTVLVGELLIEVKQHEELVYQVNSPRLWPHPMRAAQPSALKSSMLTCKDHEVKGCEWVTGMRHLIIPGSLLNTMCSSDHTVTFFSSHCQTMVGNF